MTQRNRHRRSLIAAVFAGLLLLPGCAAPPPPPPPPVLNLSIIGSAGQNPDNTGQGTTVAIRLYQLVATGKFTTTDFYSLTGQEAAVLGQDEAGASSQYLLNPGQTLTQTMPLKPGVTAIGLAVLFQQINHSTWRLTAPVAPNGPSNVTLRITGLAASIGK